MRAGAKGALRSFLVVTGVSTVVVPSAASATATTDRLEATSSIAERDQPDGAASQSGSQARSDDIIVMARKRSESILTVPVIATAITQEQLNDYAISGIDAIASRVTGLQIGNGVSQNGIQISLRGVGAGVFNPAIDQPVSLNIDGVQMTSGNAFKLGMFDLAQVEVLKGPQSLFFGKNSPGGVVSLRTADPTSELELIGRVSYEFEAREKRVEAIASGPLSDSLGLRVAGYYSDSDGFFYNRAVGILVLGSVTPRHKRFGGTEEYMLRGTALFQPTDRFTARLKVNYAHSMNEGVSQQLVSCPDGTASLSGIPFLGGEDCKADRVVRSVDLSLPAYPIVTQNGGTPFIAFDQGFGSLEMNYDVADDLTLTSLTGYAHIKQDSLYNANFSTAAGPTLVVIDTFKRRDVTQELRLTSDFPDRPLNFMVGGFFQDGLVDYRYDLAGNTALQLPPLLSAAIHKVDIRSISAFAQLLWRVVPELELAVGARWTNEKRRHRAADNITGTSAPVALAKPRISSSNISPELTVTYTPTEDLTIFAAYKHGFKSGSFDTTGVPLAGADTSFKDEKVKGGEVGIKARLADRSLNVNLAGYYYRYSDLQVGAFVTDIASGSFGIKTINAASAKVYGIDFDLRYTPPSIDDLVVTAAVNWNKARYIEFANAQCWGGQRLSDGCNQFPDPVTGFGNAQDLSGRELLRAPEWSATAAVDYSLPLTSDLRLQLGSSVLYSSSYATNFLLRPDMVQDSFFKVNARVALGPENEAWEVALIGNNLGNELVCGGAANSDFQNGVIFGNVVTGGPVRGASGIEELACGLERGREVRLRVSVKL